MQKYTWPPFWLCPHTEAVASNAVPLAYRLFHAGVDSKAGVRLITKYMYTTPYVLTEIDVVGGIPYHGSV